MAYFGEAEELLGFLEERDGEESVNALLAHRGRTFLTCAYQISAQTYRGIEEVKFTLVRYC